MARTPEFERDTALSVAMGLFWRQGYAATSTAQLLDAMGIARSSLYAAFGDKRSLFIEALDLFASRTEAIVADARTSHGPLDAIHQFFVVTLCDAPMRRVRRGCLMVNTILEVAETDPALRDRAGAGLARIEATFERYLAEAMREGSVRSTQSPAELARFLMVVNQGLRVASRKDSSRVEMLAMVDSAMELATGRSCS